MTSALDYQLHSLSISCVYYDTEINIFEETLQSLIEAIEYAKNKQTLGYCELYLINNNVDKDLIFQLCIEKYQKNLGNIIVYRDQGNIGYGKANNLAIAKTNCKYHLILNPDIITAIDAIEIGINHLELNNDVALVAPHVTNIEGNVEYLAKRMPTLFIIFLRGLDNQYLNKIFKKNLDYYSYKDKLPTNQPMEIELASGCFMLCKADLLKEIGGFSEKYFLYFEDFDLSKKTRIYKKLIYLPKMKIIHHGGNTSQKGLKHIFLFLSSAFKFLF